jgi:uncharacterized protein YjiS (DUF1127 family)
MTSITAAVNRISLRLFAEWFVNWNERRIRHKQARKTIQQLEALSDRELWDMGITRGDIYDIAHESAKRGIF